MKRRSERIKWIDVARAYAMLMVVYGHCDASSVIGRFIYLFHVPAFFFISGYVFNNNKSFRVFLVSKIKRLLVPFLFFGVGTILMNAIVHAVIGRQYAMIHYLKDMFLQIRGTESRIWFLPCLFLGEIMMYLLMEIKRKEIRNICFAVIILLGWSNILLFRWNLPWYPDTTAVAISFMLIGSMCRKHDFIDWFISAEWTVVSFVVCILIEYVNSRLGYRIDMILNEYGNPFLFYFGALFGIIFLINISQKCSIKLIPYIGKNTVTFLCLNSIAIKGSAFVINKFGITDLLIDIPGGMVIYAVIELVIVIPCLCIASYIIEIYFPFVLGQFKKKKQR